MYIFIKRKSELTNMTMFKTIEIIKFAVSKLIKNNTTRKKDKCRGKLNKYSVWKRKP